MYGDLVAIATIFITLHTYSRMLLSGFNNLYREVSHCELRLKGTRCKVPDGNHDIMVLALIRPALLLSTL